MPKAFSLVPILLVLLLGTAVGHCADAHEELNPKLKPIPTCPALLTAAATDHIPMTQVDPSSTTNTLRPGDSATVLGTLVLKKKQAQWLLYIEAAAPDPKKEPAKKPSPLVVNLFGTPVTFESKPVPAKMHMLGPFELETTSRQSKPQERNTEFSLNESFLGVGLDEAAAVIWQWSQRTNLENATSSKNSASLTNSPAKAADTNASPKLTVAEQRAISGAVPALMSYFDIVQHTEGLESLLLKLIKLPSLWSMVRHGGVNAGIFFGKEAYQANPADWGLPSSVPVYYLPCKFQMNGEPALNITLVVTAPHPPLLICGGVIGLLAEKPGDNETYMTLKVISARHGTQDAGK